MRPLVHIGLPKTGTTTLQQHLFANAPLVMNCGKPANGQADGQAVLSGRQLQVLVWSEQPDDTAAVRAHIRSLEARASTQKKRLVISDERIGYVNVSLPMHETVARRLAEVLPEAEILITVRNQLRLVPSVYAQSDRMMYSALGWPRDVRKSLLRRRLPFHSWVDALLENAEQTFLSSLHFDLLWATYSRYFSPTDVHVMPAEALPTYSSFFAERLGLTPADASARLQRRTNETGSKLSTRRGAWWLQYLLEEGGVFPQRAPSAITAAARRLARQFVRPLPHVKLDLRPAQRVALARMYANSNDRLQSRLGLNLGTFGYPVAEAESI